MEREKKAGEQQSLLTSGPGVEVSDGNEFTEKNKILVAHS